MSKIIETTVYTFSELSNASKENARAWYRDCIFIAHTIGAVFIKHGASF